MTLSDIEELILEQRNRLSDENFKNLCNKMTRIAGDAEITIQKKTPSKKKV
jgi:hypothetical protein